MWRPFLGNGCVLTWFYNGHRESRDTRQALALVVNADVPDLGAAANVHRPRRGSDNTATYTAQVVGIDLLPDTGGRCGIHNQVGSDAAYCLGKRNVGAAVQQAHGLVYLLCDRHGCLEVIR